VKGKCKWIYIASLLYAHTEGGGAQVRVT